MNRADIIAEDFLTDLRDRAAGLGNDIQADFKAVRQYAALRLAHLATCVGQPGYMRAVIAERDSVAIRLGIVTTSGADRGDQELLGMIGGALATGARMLAP
jgi:hypothetical protein